MTITKSTRQVSKTEVPGTRRVIGKVERVQYLIEVDEITIDDAPVEPPLEAPTVTLPAKTDAMFYYQHGEEGRTRLWYTGEPAPADLHINVANSIDGNNDKLNSPTVGCDWQPEGLHFWWNHEYGKSAGTRAVFSRNGWKPTGLLPYKNRTIYALLDFMAPELPIGASGNGLWTTWPVEIKAHDAYGPATVQANIDSNGNLVWATAYPNVAVQMTPKNLQPGWLHRLTMTIDMFADTAKGRFQAWFDGVQVVDMRGQMAYPSGEWAGCATFIPCLYSNQLKARTDGYIPNLILSTEPIEAEMVA